MHRFHPVYHSYTYLAGSRVDLERELEADLEEDDEEEFIDQFSEPPQFFERLSPVATQIGDTTVKGRNWTDMMIQSYRNFGKIFTRVTAFLRQSLDNNFNEKTMVPFQSITVDPDTLVRIIEHDYEAGENSYSKLVELFETGVVAPSITTPFHAILPLLPSAFDQRLCIRLGLEFFAPIMKAYHRYLASINEDEMVFAFWAPERLLTNDIIRILHEEFLAFAAKEKFKSPHLVLLMDSSQAGDLPLDQVMKKWCQPKIGNKILKDVSVIFRDPAFSDWMMMSHPSVKKMIDRTIAKVNGALDEKGVDYSWSHFESIEALTFSSKGAVNFEQRILKLCELGYLSISPDTFIRRKLNGKFGTLKDEPQVVELVDRTPSTDSESVYGRWRGWSVDKNGQARVLPDASYERKLRRGSQQSQCSPSWKIAWNKTLAKSFEIVGGNSATMKGGMLGVLADLTGVKSPEAAAANVADFLLEYGMIHWREHFIQHDLSEADIRIDEIVNRTLRKGARKKAALRDYAVASSAARAYYFLLDACNSYALEPENIDQRAMFQNTVMLTLAYCHAAAVYHYIDDEDKAEDVVLALKREVIDFKSGYDRHELVKYGVTKIAWEKSLMCEPPDSKMNIVERASRHTASRHLGSLGYDHLIGKPDTEISTNVGHHWTNEVNIPNYRWANPYFCGMKEE